MQHLGWLSWYWVGYFQSINFEHSPKKFEQKHLKGLLSLDVYKDAHDLGSPIICISKGSHNDSDKDSL